jgi:ABC-2 type transport system permease protein
LCDDDFRFHSSGKRNRHNGSFVGFALSVPFWLSFQKPFRIFFCRYQSYVILVLSVTLLDMPINGSVLLLLATSTLLIICALSLGLLISNTQSQQSAMLISMMGMLVPTMLFTGFMFPIENMPVPLQVICNIVPSKWYYIIVKSIMIKGLDFQLYGKKRLCFSEQLAFLLVVSFKKFKTRLV